MAASTHPTTQASEAPALDRAFRDFWNAKDPGEAAAASAAIRASDADFDEVFERLRNGRPYSADVATGKVDLARKGSRGLRHYYRLLVPKSYDPEKRYPVRVYLHGGVNRPAWRKGGDWWSRYERFEDPDEIAVFPSSWSESLWWEGSQADNLVAILGRLKRTYNVDENRIHLFGISDGGSGAYFFAFREPTPWASFLPFIGHPAVLGNRSLEPDGQMFVRNLSNRPLFVVNGALDQLYPAQRVLPYLDLFARAGAEVVFRYQPEGGHDTRWWPAEAENIEAFLSAHPRDPLPDRLAWETERPGRYGRVHWLVVDQLGAVPGESELADWNTLIPLPPSLGLEPEAAGEGGVRIARVYPRSVAKSSGLEKGDRILRLNGTPTPTVAALEQVVGHGGGYGRELPMVVVRDGESVELTLRYPDPPAADGLPAAFPHRQPSGRVELERTGQLIRVVTEGVRRYTLLLSPDELDLSRPLRIETNGRVSFDGPVEPDVATLLRWAARDNDRTMLFAAEIGIEVR